jgi:hypothetical protein
VCLPSGLKPSAASPGGAVQLLAASLPSCSYIQFASKADDNGIAKCREVPVAAMPPFAERNVMECSWPAAHWSLILAARITLPHFSVSSATSLPKSAGDAG